MNKCPSNMLIRTAFHTYQTQAVIKEASSQTLADKAARWFWDNLELAEQKELTQAREKALESESKKQEFDLLCKKIQERMFK